MLPYPIPLVLWCLAATGALVFACWLAYLRGVYVGSQKPAEMYELGLRDGRAAGEQTGHIAGICAAAELDLEFFKRCLRKLRVPLEKQEQVLVEVSDEMRREADEARKQEVMVEELERLYQKGGDHGDTKR